MRTIKEMFLTSSLCLLIAIPAAFAADPVVPNQVVEAKQGMKSKGEHKMFAQLNLTEDQRKQLKANKEQQRAQMKSNIQQMKAQREALHQELMKPQLDMDKINAIQTQLKANMAQMADSRLNSILEVRKILTPEQFAKFISTMKERHQRREHKMGKGHFSDEQSG